MEQSYSDQTGPWTRFPSHAAKLKPVAGSCLEEALFWAACGQIQLSEQAFAKAYEVSVDWVTLFEHAEVYRRRGQCDKQLAKLRHAQRILNDHEGTKEARLLTKLQEDDALLRKRGHIKQAFGAARAMRLSLAASPSAEHLTDIQVT